MDQPTDRIERHILIQAPRERVWRALADPEQFGAWFGANLKGQTIAPGQRVRGPITIPGYMHVTFDVVIDRVEPPALLSYRWHPHAIDPGTDYTGEEPTLVTFTLTEEPGGGTNVTVVETGFDRVPPHRRLEAFRGNSAGWGMQLENIARHVAA
jgi:uncharacterized protein YndB with AHSA1/START domain